MVKKKIQIQFFSERCSGSNFLQHLIQDNFPESFFKGQFGYKHWIPEKKCPHRDNLYYLILSRSVFGWLRSIYRTPWHAAQPIKKLNFSGFIRAEWYCVWDHHTKAHPGDPRWQTEFSTECHPVTGKHFRNILEMRSLKHGVWLDICSATPNHVVFTYDELMRDPHAFCMKFSSQTGLALPGKIRIPIGYKGLATPWEKKLHRLSLGLLGGFKARKYEPLHPADIDFVSGQLDPSIEKRMGYSVEDLVREEQARSHSISKLPAHMRHYFGEDSLKDRVL